MTAPAIRTQPDTWASSWSEATGLDCSDKPDMTRQEFRAETDVNQIMSRYGANAPMRERIYGTVDFDGDLQQALGAVQIAQDAIRKLPASLRAKYATWEDLLTGLHNGSFKVDLDAQLAAEKAARDASEAAKIALDKQGATS